MNSAEKAEPFIPSASEYILDNFEPTDRPTLTRPTSNGIRPKNGAAALFLEGKKNLLRRQQDIPLTEAEANAVEDG
jgi:hypothetical protein